VEGWEEIEYEVLEGYDWVWTHEIKPTANRRESRPSGSQNRICSSSLSLVGSLASLSTCSAKVVRFQRPTRYRSNGSPLIGNVRANPFAAPAAPVRRKRHFWLYFGVREGDSGAEPDAVEISYFRDPDTFPVSSFAAGYS